MSRSWMALFVLALASLSPSPSARAQGRHFRSELYPTDMCPLSGYELHGCDRSLCLLACKPSGPARRPAEAADCLSACLSGYDQAYDELIYGDATLYEAGIARNELTTRPAGSPCKSKRCADYQAGCPGLGDRHCGRVAAESIDPRPAYWDGYGDYQQGYYPLEYHYNDCAEMADLAAAQPHGDDRYHWFDDARYVDGYGGDHSSCQPWRAAGRETADVDCPYGDDESDGSDDGHAYGYHDYDSYDSYDSYDDNYGNYADGHDGYDSGVQRQEHDDDAFHDGYQYEDGACGYDEFGRPYDDSGSRDDVDTRQKPGQNNMLNKSWPADRKQWKRDSPNNDDEDYYGDLWDEFAAADSPFEAPAAAPEAVDYWQEYADYGDLYPEPAGVDPRPEADGWDDYSACEIGPLQRDLPVAPLAVRWLQQAVGAWNWGELLISHQGVKIQDAMNTVAAWWQQGRETAAWNGHRGWRDAWNR